MVIRSKPPLLRSDCADDVTADALLLARAVGRPVRVQLTREHSTPGTRRHRATDDVMAG